MHQSICAQPNLVPPRLLRGICPPCHSRGWGICKSCAARGPGICQPRGQPRAFDTHAVSYRNIHYTEDFTGKKKTDWLICQGWEKTDVVCKGMFSTFCMHFFIAYHARIRLRNSEAIDVNQRFLVIESSFSWYYLKNILSYLPPQRFRPEGEIPRRHSSNSHIS